MPGVPDFLVNYHLEIEWLLTLYPIKNTPHVKQSIITGGHAFHQLHDLSPNGSIVYSAQIDVLNSPGVFGFTGVKADQNGFFSIDLETQNGHTVRKKTFLVLPGTTISFMVNSVATGDEFLENTALVYQGVCTAGERFSVVKTTTTLIKNIIGINKP